MKNTMFILAAFLLFSFSLQANNGDPVNGDPTPNALVDQPATYPGGYEALVGWVQEKIEYPDLAIDNDLEGRVVVYFIVDENGKAGKFTIVEDPGLGCGKAVLAALQEMPNWQPAIDDGRQIPVSYHLPIRFRL